MTATSFSILKSAATKFGTPLYAYDAHVLRARCQTLVRSFPGVSIHYALKANANVTLLNIIRKEGLGIEAVSTGELLRAKEAGFLKKNISFTCSNMTAQELSFAARHAGTLHIDSLIQLETWGRLRLGKKVSLRLNQGIGSGHHQHTITGGPDSKFGIARTNFSKAKAIAKRYKLEITGLHQHIGSGILSASVFMEGVEALLEATQTFESVTHLDFGGGLGIPYEPDQKAWDLASLGKRFLNRLKKFENETSRTFSYSLEPGRYVIAESGVLLATVVDDKKTSSHRFIGVNTGFNHLVRPAMYGAYHKIENISRLGGSKASITIAGNVCESGDLFAKDRMMPLPRVGDVLAIRDTGAYGMSMASEYNLRKTPREVLIENGKVKDITSSQKAPKK